MTGTLLHQTLDLSHSLLQHNAGSADANRAFFLEKGLTAISIVSSPGAGKTALLERTLTELRQEIRMGAITGDLQTENDAERLQNRGAPVLQITTGEVCHLEAEMVAKAVEKMDTEGLQLLFIENVGNLVCPAAFDLGERSRVVMLSITEGEDKPLKYPALFAQAELVVVTKCDLTHILDFDMHNLLQNIRRTAPQTKVIMVSARTGHGMTDWYAWLRTQVVPEGWAVVQQA